MHFSKFLEDDKKCNIIECNKLDNNILMCKEEVKKDFCNLINLEENQYAILFEKGQIYDSIYEEGKYIIKNEPNSHFPEEFIDYKIKNNNDNLCVIFFNMEVIRNNKFYIKKKYRKHSYGDGEFDFEIENPLKFFNKVTEVRSYYSREELLEQIREKISKIIKDVIKDSKDEYLIEEEVIKSNINIFKDYGIKIISLNINNIEFIKKN